MKLIEYLKNKEDNGEPIYEKEWLTSKTYDKHWVMFTVFFSLMQWGLGVYAGSTWQHNGHNGHRWIGVDIGPFAFAFELNQPIVGPARRLKVAR